MWEKYAEKIGCPKKFPILEYKSITNENLIINTELNEFLKYNLNIYDILVINMEKRKEHVADFVDVGEHEAQT